jgi:NADPH2:quinone reductase
MRGSRGPSGRGAADRDPGPGEALVRVDSSGVNYWDIRERTGDAKAAPLPISLSMEGADVIEALGPDTDRRAPGDRVAWHGERGSYATEMIVPVEELVPRRASIDARVAASAGLPPPTP